MAGSRVVEVAVGGVAVAVDSSRVEDVDLQDAIVDMMDAEEEGDGAKALRAASHYMRLLLGDDYARVKRELREAAGGVLTREAMADFCGEVMGAIGAKN